MLIPGLSLAQSDKNPKAVSEEYVPRDEPQKISVRVRARALAVPRYPVRALEKGIIGRVVVCFSVDELGIVSDVNVLESSNEIFNAPTLAAIRESLFSPATLGGNKVSSIACRVFKYWYD